MKREIIRRFALTLKNEGKTYLEVKDSIKIKFGIEISERTIRRWWKRAMTTEWDFRDTSQKPHTIHTKFTEEDKQGVVAYLLILLKHKNS